MDNAKGYALAIMEDRREIISGETPTIFESARIERLYEFKDGAVVKYEWRGLPGAGDGEGHFNHRFSLIEPPQPNPFKIGKGVIFTVKYSES